MRIECTDVLPADLTAIFRSLYRASFDPLATKAAARQSLDDDEFADEMRNPAVVKWVAWDDAGRPSGMTFATADLSLMTWVSIPFYRERFPEQFDRGAIFYVGALLASPEHRGGATARLLLAALFRYIAERDGICAFDCCAFNIETVRFVDLIRQVGTQVAVHADLREIDVQRYYAFELREVRQ